MTNAKHHNSLSLAIVMKTLFPLPTVLSGSTNNPLKSELSLQQLSPTALVSQGRFYSHVAPQGGALAGTGPKVPGGYLSPVMLTICPLKQFPSRWVCHTSAICHEFSAEYNIQHRTGIPISRLRAISILPN